MLTTPPTRTDWAAIEAARADTAYDEWVDDHLADQDEDNFGTPD